MLTSDGSILTYTLEIFDLITFGIVLLDKLIWRFSLSWAFLFFVLDSSSSSSNCICLNSDKFLLRVVSKSVNLLFSDFTRLNSSISSSPCTYTYYDVNEFVIIVCVRERSNKKIDFFVKKWDMSSTVDYFMIYSPD